MRVHLNAINRNFDFYIIAYLLECSFFGIKSLVCGASKRTTAVSFYLV